MEESGFQSRLSRKSLTSTQTAVALIPPTSLQAPINSLRSLYDKRYTKWPVHITLLFPFVSRSELSEATARMRSVVCSNEIAEFLVELDSAGVFEHHKNATTYLKPNPESTSRICSLQRVLLRAFGADDESKSEGMPFNPHMTLGQTSLDPDVMQSLLSKAQKLVSEPVSWRVSRIAVLQREESGEVRVVDEIQLNSAENDTVAEDELFTPTGSSERRPCYGYSFDIGSWTAMIGKDEALPSPKQVTVSTYNTLIDSPFPLPRERYPLILDAIYSTCSAVTESNPAILCLQEVTDDFLKRLLSQRLIHQKYPYVSHGPVSVLPSLRNCVILSSVPFTWEWVAFPSRHKGALVAHFPGLVVAAVHLTSGLSNSSVEAKKAQMKTLTTFLQQNFGNKEWIIAGDFNLVTSSRTLDRALQKGTITKATLEIVREGVIDHNIYLDAWEMAFLPNAEDPIPGVERGIMYSGEAGATFDRLSNPLATERTSEGADTRPQRYDRVILKKGGNLTVQEVNRFGFADQGRCGSDHYGVRAVINILACQKLPDDIGLEAIEVSHSTVELPGSFVATKQERDRREAAIKQLSKCLSVDSIGQIDGARGPNLELVLAPLGSYALGVYDADSDLDLLCISVISRKTFFQLARQRIKENPNIHTLRYVHATVPMLELKIGHIKIDLQYCQAPSVLSRWSELPFLPSSDPLFFQIPPASLKPLNAYRDMQFILRTIPNLTTFRIAHSFLKTWLKGSGLYSSRFGYLGGIHLSLMLSRVFKLAKKDAHLEITASELVGAFISYHATFDWENGIVCDPACESVKLKYQRSTREAMVILGIHTPAVRHNVAQNATKLTAQTLTKHFQSAQKYISRGEWHMLTKSREEWATEFLGQFGSFIKIGVNYWGSSKHKVRSLVGWVESRVPLFLVEIGTVLPSVYARIWPNRFCEATGVGAEAGQMDLRGFYLIGVSSSSASTASRKAVLSKLTTLRHAFETQLTETKLFDPAEAWITVEQISRKELEQTKAQLDTRDWGSTVGSGSNEDDGGDDGDDDDGVGAEDEDEESDLVESRSAKPAPGTVVGKLRPAHDVLNRLRWDPAINAEDYVIGYEDRFVGIKEYPLQRWKTEKTEREFIPMHRVVYFKRRVDGVRVWDRDSRVDLVFRN